MSLFDGDSRVARSVSTQLSATEHTVLERLMSAWISALAAIVFLCALFLAAVRVIDWLHLAYVYAAITAITIGLAGMVYVSRDD